MENEDPRLIELIAAISDGKEIDWDAAMEADELPKNIAVSDRRRHEALRSLRIVASVAEFHRGVLAGQAFLDEPPDSRAPDRIGSFRIVRLIAHGGMGTVFEAEQDRPRRTVALKVIRREVASPTALRRFERETEVLARLQHPGIAQIYEAGTADYGTGPQPFFAMELIRGEPLLRHAAQHRLDTRARIELLAKVAEAVEHAHQRGIVHRDLKPANILVEENGQPKVLDFGVARAIDSDLATTIRTDAGQILGTVSYMSPEQIAGSPDEIDARSDVYSLGVILYELLAGRLPYQLSGKTIPDVAFVIKEVEPSRPSSIDRSLRGDVETIVMKALEKEKERRYPSAGSLAGDLRRYLRGEPIAARQPTKLYQARKFARRHPELVGGIVAVFLVLAAGIVATSLELVQARRQRDLANQRKAAAEASRAEAQHEAQRANRINDFLQTLLASARPGPLGTGRDVKVADVLDRAAQDLSTRFRGEPDLEMEARSTLGQTYLSLGIYAEAEKNLSRALDLATARQPEGSESRLLIADRLAWTLSAKEQIVRRDDHDFQRSEALARSSLAIARRALGNEHPRTISLMNTLAFNLIIQYKLEEAQGLLEEMVRTLRTRPEGQEVPLATVIARSAMVSTLRGDSVRAEKLTRESLAQPSATGFSAPDDLGQKTIVTAAEVMKNEGKLPEAERLYRKALADAIRILGPSHAEVWQIRYQLAFVLREMNRFPEALALWSGWLDYMQVHVPSENGSYGRAWTCASVGYLAARTHRPEEASRRYSEAIAILRALQRRGDEGPVAQVAQGWWRAWTMLLGLGSEDRWRSEAIRAQVRRVVTDGLRAHPTTTFDRNDVHWDRLRFGLRRWDPSESTPARNATEAAMEGGFEALRKLPDPAPGLYALLLEVPREGAPDLSERSWLLVSNWELELYGLHAPRDRDLWGPRGETPFRPGNEDAAWKRCMENGPEERRQVPVLALQGWADTGFGPKGVDYGFGLMARTTLDLPAGAYRFLVSGDDGARLFVDDRLVIDFWKVAQKTETRSATVQIAGGSHEVRVDYFQCAGESMLWVRAEPLDVRAEGMFDAASSRQ